ncbi:MAG: hypothetical protein L3J05_10250 [Robiginitomaculum sp.]|nr:hypothetical protein [Robiginitomaculum sp.]
MKKIRLVYAMCVVFVAALCASELSAQTFLDRQSPNSMRMVTYNVNFDWLLDNSSGHAELGTDIYDAEKRQVGRSPFTPGGALVFVPANDTFHGFEPRNIEGVRKSIIVNYVTSEWRAREQLAFPDSAIS